MMIFLAIPGGFLLTRRNRVSAGVLLALSGFIFAFSIALAVYGIAIGDRYAVLMVVLSLFWVALARMALRALLAAIFIRRLKESGVMAKDVSGQRPGRPECPQWVGSGRRTRTRWRT
jgi:hypothetical protein